MISRIHDAALVDAIEEMASEEFSGSVYRIVSEGRNPVKAGRGGRWDNGNFPVLYTSLEEEIALAEVRYHLSRQPVFPSKTDYFVHELDVATKRTLRFVDVAALEPLGVKPETYGVLDYTRTKVEVYPSTQAIGAVAHFLEFDGLIVPSARVDGSNLVLFMDRVNEKGMPHSVGKRKIDRSELRG